MEAQCRIDFYVPNDDKLYEFKCIRNFPEFKFSKGDEIVFQIGTPTSVKEGLIKFTERWQWFKIAKINYFSPIGGPMYATVEFEQIEVQESNEEVFKFLQIYGGVNGGWEWRQIGN